MRANLAVISALAANILWGLSSLYWVMLTDAPPDQLIYFRIIFSFLVLMVILIGSRQASEVRTAAGSPRILLIYAGSGLSVAVNWAAFMWGSIHGHVIETGLGYLLAPLANVAFGVLFLRERLTRARGLAVALMVVGVSILILRSADLIAWVYLTIGLTFGVFSLLRKLGPLGPLTGLGLETSLLTVWVGLGAASGALSIDYLAWAPREQILLLSLCGFVSVLPLWLFSVANRSLRLADLGFLQYALPTTQFILAVTVYGQQVSPNTLACLVIIWVALGVIVIDTLA